MSDIVTVYAVFASGDEAKRIARDIVEKRLAACANILASCHSVYRWQGRVEDAYEVPALFKTTDALAPALIDAIAKAHSYAVPAAVAWPALHVLPAYADWIESEVVSEYPSG